MGIVSPTTLKTYFERGDQPTEAQFVDLIDSFLNKQSSGTAGAVDSIASLLNINTVELQDNDEVFVLGFYSAGDGGGGEFYWDDNEDQANHNGITIIDPNHSTTPGNSGWWTSENTGSGCFKREDKDYIDVRWAGARCDGVTDDYNAIQAAFDNSDTVRLGKQQLISSTLTSDDLTLLSDNSEIHVETDYAGYAIQIGDDSADSSNRHVGTLTNLVSDASQGSNVIDSTLAGSLSVGDLVKISSDEERQSTKIGEIHSVAYVDAPTDTIHLSSALFHDYTTANNAKISKITPATFNVDGRLKIVRDDAIPDDPTVASSSYGIKTSYTKNSTADVEFDNVLSRCFDVQNCYAPKINITADNAHIQFGYGIVVTNATMFGEFGGSVRSTRHAYTSGGSTGVRGISWGNKVSMNCGATRASSFDAHMNTGSVVFDSCVSKGGTTSIGSETGNTPNVFATAALYTDINNCVAYDHDGAYLAVRDDAGATNIKRISLTNCSSVGGSITEVVKHFNDNTIDKLNIIDFNATKVGQLYRSTLGTVTYATIRGIDIEEADSDTISGRPSFIEGLDIQNKDFTLKDISITDFKGDTLFFYDNGNLENIFLEDITVRASVDTQKLINIRSDLTLLKLNNVHHLVESANGNAIPVRVTDTGFTINTIEVINSSFPAATGNTYFIDINDSSHVIDELIIDNVELPSSLTWPILHLGSPASANSLKTAYVGNIICDTQFAQMASTVSNDYLEISSGTKQSPVVCRGFGTPEGNVTAIVGSLYGRLDGGAGTTLYIKESGTGNTGWVSK